MPDVEDLLQRIVVIETENRSMQQSIKEIERTQKELLALANQGKGSLRTFLWIGGLVAGLVGLLSSMAGFYTGIHRMGG